MGTFFGLAVSAETLRDENFSACKPADIHRLRNHMSIYAAAA